MYEYKTLNRNIKEENSLFELLNAIGILENMNWRACFDFYIEILHTYGSGPSEDQTNIRYILKEKGYSENFNRSKFKGFALVQRGDHFYALIQKGEDIIQYGIVNPIYIDTCEDYVIYTKDYKYLYNQNTVRKEVKTSIQSEYSYTNLNPLGNYVGDCSIRATALGMNVDWHTSLDLLAKQAYKMNMIHLNHQDVVEKFLIKNHFIKQEHFPVKMTIKEFCLKMDELQHTETILVYAGNYHITAIQKVNYHYRIQDSWDCSKEIAGNYFINQIKQDEIKDYVDQILIHPTYGEGIIFSQEDNKLYVLFDDEERVFQIHWAIQNCKIKEA